MSSWGKKAMAWLGFKQKKPKKGATGPTATRTNVNKEDEEAIASVMMDDLENIRKRGGKNTIDFKGLLGGGGSGLG